MLGTGIAVVIDDFTRLTLARGGKLKTTNATQDKGQRALVAAFLAARATGTPPIPLATLEAVSRATLDLARR